MLSDMVVFLKGLNQNAAVFFRSADSEVPNGGRTLQNAEIRAIVPADYPVLGDFLYESIFIPPGSPKAPRSILNKPELQVYIEDFGREDDCGFAAVHDGEIVGACWARIMDDYGHIDNDTPAFALAVLEPWRGQGIGTALMEALLSELAARGWRRVSLSCQKPNRAVHLYRRLGFSVFREEGEEYIMVRELP